MRTVYSIFDFLADIGGLLGALGPINSVLIMILQFRSSYFTILSESIKANPVDVLRASNRVSTFTPSFWHVFKLNIKLSCPLFCIKKFICCRCIRMNKKERIISHNYLKLEKQLHVTYVLENLRVLKKYVKL